VPTTRFPRPKTRRTWCEEAAGLGVRLPDRSACWSDFRVRLSPDAIPLFSRCSRLVKRGSALALSDGVCSDPNLIIVIHVSEIASAAAASHRKLPCPLSRRYCQGSWATVR
jgi:hypothetical protein